jgi:sec-independent protein translocase protein TatA
VPNVGPLEIVVILVLVALIFGAKRVPELARSAGKGIREFRSSVRVDDDDAAEGSQPPQVPASTEAPPASRQGSSK